MMAILACGDGARVSHRSALALWGLITAGTTDPVHVSVAASRINRPGIIVHRVADVDRADVMKIEGIPITTPLRTILDVAKDLRERELEQAVAGAMDRCLLSQAELRSRIEHHHGHRGIRRLRGQRATGPGPLRG